MTREQAIREFWVTAGSDLREHEYHEGEIIECKYGDVFVDSHFYNGCEFTAPVNLIDCVVEHRDPIPIANGAVNSVFIWLGAALESMSEEFSPDGGDDSRPPAG